jgi:putative molybdopterin biosynthesis protein
MDDDREGTEREDEAPAEPPLPASSPRFVAWPMGKGSGSVTTFSQADGFLTIGRHEEIVEAGARVQVTLLGRDLAPADLVVVGSHCIGLDLLLGQMHRRGWQTRLLAVGSSAGLEAAKRGQCDVAGIHLLDPVGGTYNEPFCMPAVQLVRGYGRMQGVVYRPGDARFANRTAAEAIDQVRDDAGCLIINRNAGSGTRILIDRQLGGRQPAGYQVQPKSHTAVAVAVAQQRADWGVCIESVARHAGLAFLPLQIEQYDFVVPRSRHSRPAVVDFLRLLSTAAVRDQLRSLGMLLD